MEMQRLDIPVLGPDDPLLPEGTTSPGAYHTLCAALTSIAETIARGHKYNPTTTQYELTNDLRRLLTVVRARRYLTRDMLTDIEREDLTLFLTRDAGFSVPVLSAPELTERALAAASAMWDLVEFMKPYVTPHKE